METATFDVVGLEVRDAGGGRHELEGICVPYDKPTTRAGNHPELFRAGAFADLVAAGKRAKVRLTDGHPTPGSNLRPVGLGAEFAERADGLFGRFRFYDTPQGRAAFENAREGTYGGLSVGFVAQDDLVTPAGREVRSARLDHVALVDEPAYDDAQVVAVRGRQPGDPDRYAIFRRNPVTIDLATVPDTPLRVRVRSGMSTTRP